jgi:Flp pilus assembly protein TadD
MRRLAPWVVLCAHLPSFVIAGELAATDEDRLWLHRNLGAAYLDNDAFGEGAAQLERAAELAPASFGDLRNAGIASLLAGELEDARPRLERAAELDSRDPSIHYALGILSKRSGDPAGARAALLRCRELGGESPELRYNLGILAVRSRDEKAALAEFQAIVDLGRERAPRHYASALYRYGRTLLSLGKRDEGAKVLGRYQELVRAGQGAELSEEDLEVGELLNLTPFERPAHVRAAGPLPAFQLSPLPARGEIRWADARDLDGDGDLDLLLGDGQTLADLRDSPQGWVDVTASRGLAGVLGVTRARALDVDDDGAVDLVRGGGRGIHVHRGVEAGWDPPFAATSTPISTFAPVDVDHEGDIDVVAVGAQGVLLLQNNGDRTFADVTGAAGLDAIGAATAVAAADVDDDQDVDLVFVTRKGEVVVAANQRGGRFAVGAPLAAAPPGSFDLALADLDSDGLPDLAVATPQGVFAARNEGGLAFERTGEPVIRGPAFWPPAGGNSLWAADLDNDGLRDLLAARETGAALAVNEGAFRFLETAEPMRPLTDAGVRPVAVVVSSAGRLDLVGSRATHAWARNVGRTGASVVVVPRGVENNRDAVGTIVECLAGSRYARAESGGSPVHFGVGSATKIDALRVRWPNGIRQAVLDPKPGERIDVPEKAGLVGSCPFLYTWNGDRHEFVTDILTVTPLGLPIAPGAYVPPDWDEAIRVTDDQMVPDDDGFLVAQVTEELREVTYLDQVRLYAIDHPVGTEVQPNEKFQFPPFPEFGVHVLEDPLPPLRAIDHRGRDATASLLETDGIVVGDLDLTGYQGIVQMHSLELDFGEVPADAALTLHLAGWFYWTNASINLAIAQDARHEFVPPGIEVKTQAGWRKWPEQVGFPGGKTKSIPVDLTGAFPDGRAVLRISTTLRLYWDRALLQVGKTAVTPVVTMLLPDSADLHFRGHSEPILSTTGEEPETFDYDELRTGQVPWDQHPGMYTKYGDVTPLLQDPDDMYAIMASGDECTVRWTADRLPPLDDGWARTYFLVFDGWAKDGDPNTTFATTVEPLPFHGMSGYPYGADESYPAGSPWDDYRATWNTRPAVRLAPDLASAASSSAPGSPPPASR